MKQEIRHTFLTFQLTSGSELLDSSETESEESDSEEDSDTDASNDETDNTAHEHRATDTPISEEELETENAEINRKMEEMQSNTSTEAESYFSYKIMTQTQIIKTGKL